VTAMKKKPKIEDNRDLWVAPRYSLRSPSEERVYENQPGRLPTTNRFLELADIALGHKKPAKKKKAAAAAASSHGAAKKEPSSR
jgi:hypothetical protein